jgi:serine/threonine-protein kinase
MLDPVNKLASSLAGRYDIERKLGAGAMATVFLARDCKHDRNVALKVLRQDVAESIGSDRFLREIRLVARLSHPHILPLFDSGEANGFLYYVMPNVEGCSLRDRLEREAKLPIEDAVRFAREVADALDYAHRHGVVHRDIKPENIMLHDGHALVADFGIGKAVSAVEDSTSTAHGVTVGTPAYMSPEQAAGEVVDGRSDIYSLGCVLYEMLVGEQPFTGTTAQAVIAKRFVQIPADVAALREGVPRPIARAVRRALSRAPIDRYETAAAFVAGLSQTGAIGTAALLGAPEKSIAVLPFTNMSADRENEFFADGITEDILNALSHIRDLRVVGRASAFSFKDKKHDLQAIGDQLEVRTVLDGSVRRVGSRVRITAQLVDVADGHSLWSERYDRELEDVFAVQDEIATAIAERLKAPLDETRAIALAGRVPEDIDAYQAYLKGRALLHRRGHGIKQGMAMMERALALDPNYGLAFAGLADGYSMLGLFGLARPEDNAASARRAATKALDVAPDVAEANGAMAMVSLLFDWDFAVAERLFKRALELNPGYIQGGSWYYGFYVGFTCARWREAIDGLGRLEKLDRLSGYVAVVLSIVHSVGGDPDEALRWSERAVELEPESYVTLWTRQAVFWRKREWAKALDASDALLGAFGRAAIPLARLAAIFVDLGQLAEARSVYQEMLSRDTQSRTRGQYFSLTALAMAASAIGETTAAMAFAREAVQRRDSQIVYMARTFPEFKRLRALPEFQEILTAMKLPGWHAGESQSPERVITGRSGP